jgi:hypothetical protein
MEVHLTNVGIKNSLGMCGHVPLLLLLLLLLHITSHHGHESGSKTSQAIAQLLQIPIQGSFQNEIYTSIIFKL